MLTYYGIPLSALAINPTMGNWFPISMRFQRHFAVWPLLLVRAAYTQVKPFVRPSFLLIQSEIEAARGLGMTRAQVCRRVIIPNGRCGDSNLD